MKQTAFLCILRSFRLSDVVNHADRHANIWFVRSVLEWFSRFEMIQTRTLPGSLRI